jgi:hypothetical protein
MEAYDDQDYHISVPETRMSREEFNKYWLSNMVHWPPNSFCKYVQNHFVTVPGREFEGDGIVEMWYDDVASFEKSYQYIFNSPASKELAVDASNFCGKGGQLWIVEEHVIKDDLTKK